ncbi:MAG: AraC family transcriptional regulator [Acinetobacter sp.]
MTIMVHASGIRGYLEVMQDLKFDPEPLLAQHNITLEQLKQDDAWLCQRSVINLFEQTAAIAQCPDLGLRVSRHQDISVLGVLGIILQSAPSIRGVIEYTSDFMFLHGPGLVMSLNQPSPLFEDAAEVIFEIQINGYAPQRQTIDNCLGTTHRILKWLAAENYELKAVSLPHKPLAALSEYQRFFGAPILVNQQRAALHLSRQTLQSQPHSTNQALREIAQDYITRHFRNPTEQVSANVRKALRIHLATSHSDKTHIAEMLAFHPRTLQRKLADEGTSFDEIKDEIRKELALQYLWNTQISISQLTDILGFTKQSALSRASKRWFGHSPKDVRHAKGQLNIQNH